MTEGAKNPRSELTDQEAEVLLVQLQKHYNEPVQPLSKFCTAMRTWVKAIQEGIERADEQGPTKFHDPKYQFGRGYAEHLTKVLMDISKSYLLARLLYDKEPLRTEKCPKHDGHWNGQAQLLRGCTYGCDGSGFLKTPELVAKRLERLRSYFKKTDEEAIEFVRASVPVEEVTQEMIHLREYYEWVTLLGHGDLVPESQRG